MPFGGTGLHFAQYQLDNLCIDMYTYDMEDKLLSLKEMAEYLGVSVMTARRYAKAGTVPTIKVGRLWRIKQSALEKYVNKKGRKATMAELTVRVDNLLNTCGTDKPASKAVRKYMLSVISEVEADRGSFTEGEMEQMVHAFNEGYMAALKNKQ